MDKDSERRIQAIGLAAELQEIQSQLEAAEVIITERIIDNYIQMLY